MFSISLTGTRSDPPLMLIGRQRGDERDHSALIKPPTIMTVQYIAHPYSSDAAVHLLSNHSPGNIDTGVNSVNNTV